MKGLKLFWELFKESFNEVLKEKKMYFKAFLALILFSNLESSSGVLGVSPESNFSIFLIILSTLCTFIVISQIVLTQKKLNGGTGELKYFVPTFLLYNLYYSFMFFAGLLFLLVPGFYILIFFSLVPFVAVLDDDCKGSLFRRSNYLVKKNISLVAWTSAINLIFEFSAFIITPIQDPIIKAIANLIYSIPEAFVTVLMTVTIVKIYYHLKALSL